MICTTSSEDHFTWSEQTQNDWSKHWLKWSVDLIVKQSTEEEQQKLPYISNENIESWTGKLLIEDPQPVEANSRKFNRNDVLFNKLRPYLAKVYHASFNGVSSSELLCLRPSQNLESRFLFYVLISKNFIDAVNAKSFGAKMPRADWEIVGHQSLPLPPLESQRRITEYLDEKTARIDRLIGKKRKLLDLLTEKRSAMIIQAVTKGTPDLKRSKNCEHYSVRRRDCRVTEEVDGMIFSWSNRNYRLKWLFSNCKNGAWGNEPDGETDIVCIRAADFEGTLGRLNRGNRTLRSIDSVTYEKLALRNGDIILEKSGGGEKQLVGRAVLFDGQESSITSNFLARCRPVPSMHPVFINYLLLAIYNTRGTFPHLKQSIGIQNLDQASFLDIRINVPNLNTQRQISEYLDENTAQIDELSMKIQESIVLLEEYKSVQITTVVSGQKSVP